MSNFIRGKQYWGEKEELLCQQWKTADRRKQYEIYNKLLPRLNEMAEYIINRYFNVLTSYRLHELKREAVEEVFLKLNRYEVGRAKSGAYSFCSLVIKHYAHDTIVYVKERRDYIDYEFVDDYGSMQPMEYHERMDLDTNLIKKMINEKRNHLIAERERKRIHAKKIRYRNIKTPTENRNIEILNLFDEYLNKFDFDINAIIDYIYINSESNETKETVIKRFRQLFGYLKLEIKEDFNIDSRYDYLQDDYTPDFDVIRKRAVEKARLKRIKKSMDNDLV